MKILLVGQSPLPIKEEGGNRVNAPGVRAWHFAKALTEAGHEVRLVAVQTEIRPLIEPRLIAPRLILHPILGAEITQDNLLARLEAEFKPDALVAASVWPSYLVALFGSADLPFWADLFGSPLAEGQAKAALYANDSLIEPFARFETTVLARADVVSGVSSYQEYALVGGLAGQGRLNRHTYGYRLAYTIPAALDERVLAHDQTVLRAKIVPENAFVVLWSGGYNTWTDVDTLFAGLESAMLQTPRLHFVSTGGALPPHDSLTYPHFQSLVETSAYRDRYHLLGWLPYEVLQNYYYESDLGIILDKWSYEGVLGSRTRLLDWLKYGLPAAVTLSAELTRKLGQAGLAFPFPHGDGPMLGKLLLELANNPAKLKEAGQRGKDYVLRNFNYMTACAPLRAWAENPRRAPDAGQPRPFTLANSNQELEKQLAIYKSQLEAKNSQIAALETWAHEMEATIKQQENGPRTSFNNLLVKIKRGPK